jgi:glutamyl-tRNA synthetase
MGLFNIEITHLGSGEIHARFHSKSHQEARELDFPFVHWLPSGVGIQARVVMPNASTAHGIAEERCGDLEIGSMIQFERFGFVRVDNMSPFVAYYAHR